MKQVKHASILVLSLCALGAVATAHADQLKNKEMIIINDYSHSQKSQKEDCAEKQNRKGENDPFLSLRSRSSRLTKCDETRKGENDPFMNPHRSR